MNLEFKLQDEYVSLYLKVFSPLSPPGGSHILVISTSPAFKQLRK